MWEKAVSGKVGIELSRKLREVGIVDPASLRRNPNLFQQIELEVFLPLAEHLVSSAKKKETDSGEAFGWGKIRGYNAEFEDLMYTRGIFSVEDAERKMPLVARLISKHRGADMTSLRVFAEQPEPEQEIETPTVMEEQENE